jgi:alkylhydroperoxidase/carboxymuconolactone decarboxylase family protein YurZ
MQAVRTLDPVYQQKPILRRPDMQSEEKNQKVIEKQVRKDLSEIVDYKVTMLIAAGAAMAANCEPCLNQIVPDLLEAGVAEADIRKAVEIGQFVKDKPAAVMKEAADMLTGSHLLKRQALGGCPVEEMKKDMAIAGSSG